MILTDENGNKFEFTGEATQTGELKPVIEKWEPEIYKDGYSICGVNSIGTALNLEKHAKIGNLYETWEEAKSASNRRVSRELLNQVCLQENRLTGYTPDWNDETQGKHYIAFSPSNKKFMTSSVWTAQEIGSIPVNISSAQRIIEMLNSGALDLGDLE